MNTTAEPGPARRNGSMRARQIITAGAQVDVQRGVPQLVVDEVERHRPRHTGAMNEATDRPKSRLGPGTADSMAAVSATSTTVQCVVTPCWLHNRAVSSAPAASTSQMATGRPTSANARAVWRPMPEPPPVTSTPVRAIPAGPGTARCRWPGAGGLPVPVGLGAGGRSGGGA